MKLEKEIMKQIKHRLEVWRLTGYVINFHRLNAGTVRNSNTGSWVKLGDKDNPDWIVIVRNREDGISILYIEAKSDKGRIRTGQTEFINKYGTKEGVFVMVLRDIKDLDKWIDKNAKDYVSLI